MSDRERVFQLLDIVPDNKISYVLAYVQGLTADEKLEPNSATINAINEAKGLTEDTAFEGTVDEFFDDILNEA